MMDAHFKFALGEIVRHKDLNLRGVVVEMDDKFVGTEEMYNEMEELKPEKNQPWYQVIIDGEEDISYIPERLLVRDGSPEPIRSSLIPDLFQTFENGKYSRPTH